MRKAGGGSSDTTPCCSKVGIKRGPWTAEEDEILSEFVRKEGEGRWRTLPKRAGLLRCGKSCRLRWMNYLRPSVKRGHIAPDEEDLILRLHRLLGNRWSLIAGRIPGRTDNEIKNYWNTHLSKKLISQGIDPRTHKPFKPDHHDTKASSSSCKVATQDHRRRIIHSNPKNIKQNTTQITAQRRPSTSQEDHDHAKALTSHGKQAQVSSQVFEQPVGDDHYDNYFPNSEGSQCNNNNNNNVGFGSSSDQTNLVIIGNNDEDGLNYCSDDVFSSFLNSLINEDAFLAPPAHQQQHMTHNIGNNNNIVSQFPTVDPFLSPKTTASNAWETPITSSSFDHINHS